MAKAPTSRVAKAAAVPTVSALSQNTGNYKDPYMDGSGGWPTPMFTNGMAFKDIGSSGLRQFGGYVREEFLPQVQGRQAARVFREMSDNSPTVGAIIYAVTQSIRKLEWDVTEANDSGAAQEMVEFVKSLMDDMSGTWGDFIAEALSMLIYGFAPHEIVYKVRGGRQKNSLNPNAPPSSKYDDGRIGIRKLPIRGQDTVIKWFFGVNGETLGLTQQPWVGPLIDLPIEKLLLFRPSAHKGNPEGRSILRTAYRPYHFAKRMEEQEGIMGERMSGFPVMYVPSALLDMAATGDSKAVAQLATYKKMVTNVRIDEQMGLLLPSDVYPGPNGPSSVRMYEFALVVPQNRGGVIDFDKTVTRHNLDILMSTMCDFLVLGHQSRGTQNLSLNKVDMFFQAIEGWVNSIADVLNQFLLPRVWELNGLDFDLMPTIKPDLAQRVDLDSLGNFIMHLSQSGMMMFPDEDLENYIRDAAGLPELSDGDPMRQAMMEADLAAAQARAEPPAPGGPPTAGTELTKALLGDNPAMLQRMFHSFVAKSILAQRKAKKGGRGPRR